MRVALIHYWLVGMRGGEKVLESLCRLFPQADIYTHVLNREAISACILRHNIRTTFIARLPKATRWYQKYLPLMPLADSFCHGRNGTIAVSHIRLWGGYGFILQSPNEIRLFLRDLYLRISDSAGLCKLLAKLWRVGELWPLFAPDIRSHHRLRGHVMALHRNPGADAEAQTTKRDTHKNNKQERPNAEKSIIGL